MTNYTFIGNGVYNLSEAAKYTGLSKNRIISWYRGKSAQNESNKIFQSDYKNETHKLAFSFYDLIDMLVAKQFRDFGLQLKNIKETYNSLKYELKTDHPFCHQDLYTDGKKIIIKLSDTQNNIYLKEVINHQQLFDEIENKLSKIKYDTHKIAELWNISEGIMIDPKRNFGKPIVMSDGTITRISTSVVSKAYTANDKDEQFVAELFDITPEAVINAYNFEEHLLRLAA